MFDLVEYAADFQVIIKGMGDLGNFYPSYICFLFLYANNVYFWFQNYFLLVYTLYGGWLLNSL